MLPAPGARVLLLFLHREEGGRAEEGGLLDCLRPSGSGPMGKEPSRVHALVMSAWRSQMREECSPLIATGAWCAAQEMPNLCDRAAGPSSHSTATACALAGACVHSLVHTSAHAFITPVPSTVTDAPVAACVFVCVWAAGTPLPNKACTPGAANAIYIWALYCAGLAWQRPTRCTWAPALLMQRGGGSATIWTPVAATFKRRRRGGRVLLFAGGAACMAAQPSMNPTWHAPGLVLSVLLLSTRHCMYTSQQLLLRLC